MNKNQKWDDYMQERLSDKEYAKTYLSVALEEYNKDNDKKALLLALNQIANAQGGLTKLAKECGISRQHLYHMLSEKGNPTLENLQKIFNYFGYRISLEKIA